MTSIQGPAGEPSGVPPTVAGVRFGVVVVPFARPFATKIGYFERWPLVLIDLHTRGGPTGHA